MVSDIKYLPLGFLFFGGGLPAFAVDFAALAFLGLVVLFAHNCCFTGVLVRACLAGTMKAWRGISNVFFMGVVMVLLGGCSSMQGPVPGGRSGAMLFIFVESASRDPELTRRIEWHEANPREAHVEREPVMQPLSFLTEAKLHESVAGGQVAELHFNFRGTQLLEAMSIEQRGRRLFLVAWYLRSKQDKDLTSRCIGVHALRGVNSSGRLFFTPDATPEEAGRLMAAFNKTARVVQR